MCVVDLVPSSYPGTQTRLGGVLALYVLIQYEPEFMQESPSNSPYIFTYHMAAMCVVDLVPSSYPGWSPCPVRVDPVRA